ncbi:hypothetical protein [Nocardia salmonicida]|uniref:hypothetical protein n=1 Tax=Nocardia salmonicida TaxID=53431 RepID=UPI0037A5D6E9
MATIEVFRADDLGPALHEARIAEDLTQQDLASIAAVGRQWLRYAEHMTATRHDDIARYNSPTITRLLSNTERWIDRVVSGPRFQR